MNFFIAKKNRIFAAINLLRQAFGKFKLQIIILTILGFLMGLLESVGVNAIIPLFSFVLKEENSVTDFVSRLIEKMFNFLSLEFNFVYLLIFIALLFIIKGGLILLANYINAYISSDYEKQIRGEMFKKIIDTSWPYLINQKIGHLEKILIDHVNRNSLALRYLSDTILLLTSLTMYAFVAIMISPIITFFTVIAGGFLFLIFKPLFYKTKKISRNYREDSKSVSNIINENMVGIKTIKATASEYQVYKKAETYFKNLKNARIKLSFLGYIPAALIQPISVVFILVVFAFSYTNSNFNIASFAVIIYLIQRIFTYVQNAQGKIQTIYESAPYLKSVAGNRILANQNREKRDGLTKFDFKDELKFKNIVFSYNKEKGEVLSGINFNVKKGDAVGIVGPSGAGKTTIIDLLLRLIEPDQGEILLDNKNISKLDVKVWRRKIGYVSQDIFLLNDTIENNIKFYNDNISKEEIIQATKMANIYSFVAKLPEKFSTKVGERGVMLSAGQRQRIILARALVRKPEILVLDEATSALDNESEILIQNAIKDLKGKVTALSIAHRLSTIMSSDKLIVIENGKITEQGSPRELLANKNSYFHKIYHIRNGKFY